MFWLDIDKKAQITTLHTENCIHIVLDETETKGLNRIKSDGGLLSFKSAGEAMRYFKVNKLNGPINSCLFCKPLDHIDEVAIAKLDVKIPGTGCEMNQKEMEIVDTKSNYRRILSRLGTR